MPKNKLALLSPLVLLPTIIFSGLSVFALFRAPFFSPQKVESFDSFSSSQSVTATFQSNSLASSSFNSNSNLGLDSNNQQSQSNNSNIEKTQTQISANISTSQNPDLGQTIELNEEILIYANYGKASFNFTKQVDVNSMYFFAVNRYGENTLSQIEEQMQNIKINDQVKISGKAKLWSESAVNKKYTFTEITKIEKVDQTASQSQESEQTYTNPFLPNVKINYGNGWKLTEKTSESKFWKGVTETELALQKNDSVLTITLQALYPTGCGAADPDYWQKINQAGDFTRYEVASQYQNESSYYKKGQYSYFKGDVAGCNLSNKVKSNFKNSEIQLTENTEYLRDMLNKKETMGFFASVNLQSQNAEEALEADKIIKNSIIE